MLNRWKNRRMPKVKVLFVCMGNICRSPTAEGVFRKVVKDAGLEHKFEIDSAGTIGYHAGERPDQRAQDAASNRGYDLSKQKARQVKARDYEYYDYILAMDMENLKNLEAESSDEHRAKIQLFLEFASNADTVEVPDPYYGSLNGFDRVLDLVEDASKGLLDHIKGDLTC